MNAYLFQAALYCEHCAKQIIRGKSNSSVWPQCMKEDSDYFPQGPYSQSGGEADTPQHCDSCNVFLENPLTPDGRDYIIEKLNEANIELEHDQSWSEIADACDHMSEPVLAEWVRYYLAP